MSCMSLCNSYAWLLRRYYAFARARGPRPIDSVPRASAIRCHHCNSKAQRLQVIDNASSWQFPMHESLQRKNMFAGFGSCMNPPWALTPMVPDLQLTQVFKMKLGEAIQKSTFHWLQMVRFLWKFPRCINCERLLQKSVRTRSQRCNPGTYPC